MTSTGDEIAFYIESREKAEDDASMPAEDDASRV
jgi:hypothetical protein